MQVAKRSLFRRLAAKFALSREKKPRGSPAGERDRHPARALRNRSTATRKRENHRMKAAQIGRYSQCSADALKLISCETINGPMAKSREPIFGPGDSPALRSTLLRFPASVSRRSLAAVELRGLSRLGSQPSRDLVAIGQNARSADSPSGYYIRLIQANAQIAAAQAHPKCRGRRWCWRCFVRSRDPRPGLVCGRQSPGSRPFCEFENREARAAGQQQYLACRSQQSTRGDPPRESIQRMCESEQT